MPDAQAWVLYWSPDKRTHIPTHDRAMTHANFLSMFYRERFWVTRDAEGGWYIAPASDRPSAVEGS